MAESPYKTPESDLYNSKSESEPTAKRILRRRAYFGSQLLVWIVIPVSASIVVTSLGLGEGAITQTGSGENTSYNLDSLYLWYISLPLFFWFTYKRVKDAGLAGWLTLVFALPLINVALWFWPPKSR